MNDCELGPWAFSKAGRTIKGKLFFVTSQEGAYVYLADGKNRTVKSEKKKKRKQISQYIE
jgi:hypothetical protein